MGPGGSAFLTSSIVILISMISFLPFFFFVVVVQVLSCVPLFAPYHTPHGLQLARLPGPLPFPSDPMDYRVHGILQARILEWVAFPFSRGSSQPRDRTQVS